MKRFTTTNLYKKSYLSDIPSSPNIQQTVLYDKITKVQEMIHSKLSDTKKLKSKNFCCDHTSGIETEHNLQQKTYSIQNINTQLPEPLAKYDSTINYYDRFWKQFLLNQMSKNKLEELFHTVKQINKKTGQIENLFDERDELLMNSENIVLEKSFRKRYKKQQPKKQKIQQRYYKCPFSDCFKEYGSDVSLNLHMKLKHNAGNKSERQYYAELVWNSIQAGKKRPEVEIQFPPGYMEQYGMITGRVSAELYQQQRKLSNWQSGQVDKKSVLKKQQPQKLSKKTKRQD